MHEEKQNTPVLSRGMLVVLVVSLILLGCAGAVFGVAMHDQAAYPRVLEQVQALDTEAAQKTLEGVVFFHDPDEADYARCADGAGTGGVRDGRRGHGAAQL